MRRPGLEAVLGLALLAALLAGVLLGETGLSAHQYLEGFSRPGSAAAQILWSLRAPRAVGGAVVGAASACPAR